MVVLIDDDTVQAHRAARDLVSLYLAYQAETAAQAVATSQIRRRIERRGLAAGGDPALAQTRLRRTEAFLSELAATYDLRRRQVERRLLELRGVPRLP